MRHARLALALVIALAMAPVSAGCGDARNADADATAAASAEEELRGDRHLGFGVPSDGRDVDDHVIVHEQYAVSYNRFRNGANWVAWVLTASDFGEVGRWPEDFFPDPALPSDFHAVAHDDYSNSGWTRGHLVRSDERTRTVTDNKATFHTTNILPQSAELNGGPWLRFENYCKGLVLDEGEDLYLVAGAIFPAACRTDREPDGNLPSVDCPTIGRSDERAYRIAVPSKFWKIAVHLPRGKRLAAIDEATRITAVVLSNVDAGVAKAEWTSGLTTVDAIEEATGYDLLDAVPQAIQRVIEDRVDTDARDANPGR